MQQNVYLYSSIFKNVKKGHSYDLDKKNGNAMPFVWSIIIKSGILKSYFVQSSENDLNLSY